MKLKSDNVLLTPLDESDLDYIHSITSDYSYLSKTFPSFVRSKVYWQKRFEETGLWSQEYGMLKMSSIDESRPFGIIWFFNPWQSNHMSGIEIAFRILDKHLLTDDNMLYDSIKIFCAYIFETYPYPRIQFNTLLKKRNNMNEISLAKKTGFRYEGTQKKIYYCRGKYQDMHLFSLVREESEPLNELLDK